MVYHAEMTTDLTRGRVESRLNGWRWLNQMVIAGGTALVVGCPFEPDSPSSGSDGDGTSMTDPSTSTSAEASAETTGTSAGTTTTTSATTATSSATTETSTNAVDSTGADSSSANESSTGAAAAPCADGEYPEGAEALWQRDDIAVCPNDDPTVLPASEGSAEALCNTSDGWRLCDVADARDRNDDCMPGYLNFAAVVATGENNCVVFDNADPTDPHFKCNSDFARASFAGSCGGIENADEWGFHDRGAQTSGGDNGALCCHD